MYLDIFVGCCLVPELCPTLWPHGLWPPMLLCLWDFPARILEWAATSSSSIHLSTSSSKDFSQYLLALLSVASSPKNGLRRCIYLMLGLHGESDKGKIIGCHNKWVPIRLVPSIPMAGNHQLSWIC